MNLDPRDHEFLERCVVLAEAALEAGNPPFGSILVDATGQVLAEEHNRTAGGDPTAHPEFLLARWAALHLDAPARGAATMYTSGEHCPMCAAAHGLAGIGRIVYASSAAQLAAWQEEMGLPPGPVRRLPIGAVIAGVRVDGPDPALSARIRGLQRRWHGHP